MKGVVIMKNRKLLRWLPWFIFALLCGWYLANTKDLVESILLVVFSSIIIIIYNKEKVKFVNYEIKDKMVEFKIDIAALIITDSFSILAFSCINVINKTVFWGPMVSLAIFIFLSWVVTYKSGTIILTEINPKKKSIFFSELIESIFERTTSLIVFIIVISLIIFDNDFYYVDPSFEQVVKIELPTLALLLPTIKMYNFIISEYYEYSKNNEEREKRKHEELEQKRKEKYRYDFYNYD